MSEKFEKHNDMLFRMLEEPVPLTDDAELPVLVRLIQDDTMLGKANKRSYHPDTLAQKIICSSSNLTDDGLFMDGNYTYRYEIIGTFVDEGSAEWALYQMMQGKMVCHKTSRWDWYRMYNDHAIQNRTAGCMPRVSAWLESTVQSGWQIYTEPKPESENIIHGHIPADMRLKYFHLYEFKVGDWVEWSEGLGISYQSQITRVSQSAVYSKGICIPLKIITKKLKPSEVVIHVGCLSGTVKDLSYAEDGRFWLIGKVTERCPGGMYAILYGEMLDTPTRKLVEGLLRAQEEEK